MVSGILFWPIAMSKPYSEDSTHIKNYMQKTLIKHFVKWNCLEKVSADYLENGN